MSLVYGMMGTCPVCGKENGSDVNDNNPVINYNLDTRTHEESFQCVACNFSAKSELKGNFWVETYRYPISKNGEVRRPSILEAQPA